jgi:type III pantothenate kinase
MIYAKKLFRNSVIVIDFGTATTLDVLDHRGVYSGGVITPGIDLSLNTLKKMTAKLPLVKFKRTKNVVGRNTVQAIQSGFFWGYVSMIEGLINKLNQEKNDRFKIILTGGNANFFKKMFKNISLIDDLFTSRALNYIISEVKK